MTDLSRRWLLACAPALLLSRAMAADSTEISMEGSLPPLPADLQRFANEPAYRQFTTEEIVGSATPSPTQVAVAKAIMAKAPFGVAPYKVAEYFLAVGNGGFDKEWQPYTREWPVVANPLIVNFFKATRTIPQGDTTPWCAAFINWCIAQGNAKLSLGDGAIAEPLLNLTSRSASSGSFRCWLPVAEPKIGDLVVFVEPGTENIACSGAGHVSFFYGRTDDGRVRILGGNQTLEGTSGAVTIGRYPLKGGEGGRLKFLGWRTADALRSGA